MIRYMLWPLLLLLAACGRPETTVDSGKRPERLISMAPNITEMLHDLGLDDRLVGISDYGMPDPGREVQIVGDFLNINYETVVSLQPDLVILEKSADIQKSRLDGLGIRYLETGSLSIEEVMQAIRDIGEACSVTNASMQLIERFRSGIGKARNQPAHRPRILLTFGAASDGSAGQPVYAFGAGCIHSELLAIAGGDNVVTDAAPSVILSREALLRLNPEIIIELTAGGPANRWDDLGRIDAVRAQRIYVLDGDYTCIPSPGGLLHTLNDLSEIIAEHAMP